jgi:hypothetical protein
MTDSFGVSSSQAFFFVALSAIRKLNDALRTNLMTAGVAALGAETVARIGKTMAVYDDFRRGNDRYEEQDLASFGADGHVIFFKIDYFDKSRCYPLP